MSSPTIVPFGKAKDALLTFGWFSESDLAKFETEAENEKQNLEDYLLLLGKLDDERYELLRHGMELPALFKIAGLSDLRPVRRTSQGSIWQAKQTERSRSVALKVLDRQSACHPQVRAAFRDEAKLLGELRHDRIVRGYSMVERGSLCVLVMEWVEGRSLEALVVERGPMDETTTLMVLRDIANALVQVHQKGYLHRDIKPANIMLEAGRRAKLIDLGLACLAESHLPGMLIGTPNYMAPEQITGHSPLSACSDLYALGVTAYFLLTGTTPYHGSPEQVIYRQAREATINPRDYRHDLSDNVVNLVLSLLAKDPALRPQSAADLVARIGTVLEGGSLPVPTLAPPPLIAVPNPISAPALTPVTLPRARKHGGIRRTR